MRWLLTLDHYYNDGDDGSEGSCWIGVEIDMDIQLSVSIYIYHLKYILSVDKIINKAVAVSEWVALY